MNEQAFFNGLIIGWFLLAAVVFATLFFTVAPYGRYACSGWGPTIAPKTGWVVMEAAAPLVFAVCFMLGRDTNTVTALALFALWEAHYLRRAFIYLLGLRGRNKRMPLVIVAFGLLFNVVNGYLNGRYIFTLSGGYSNQWLGGPRFIVGLVLFLAGFIINRRANHMLRNLRQPGTTRPLPSCVVPRTFPGLYPGA